MDDDVPADPVKTAGGRSSDGPDRAAGASLGWPYWRLWFASAMSNVADGTIKIALPLIAVTFTQSPGEIAGLTSALTLPWLVCALPAGALADRFDRRRMMLLANTARVAVLAVLAILVATAAGSIWVLYVAAATIGVAETVYDTSAQSLIPHVVRADQLGRANGRLYAAELTGNQFIGPPAAGVLVAVSAVVAVGAPAALWAIAVLALLLVSGQFRPQRCGESTVRADIAHGLRFLWSHRVLRTLSLMSGLFNLASSAVFTIFVLYAVGPESPMGLSSAAYGLLISTIAVGGVLGSFVAEWCEKYLGRLHTLVMSMLAGALLFAVPAVTVDPFVIGAVFLVGGAGTVMWNVVTVSLRQRITPDHLLGRVNSSNRLISWGAMPLGAAAGGALAQFLGLRPVFLVMAALTCLTLTGLAIATTAAMNAAERDAEVT